MSFISKLWKDRVSDYPNKRKLTKEDGTSETVTVERAEGDIVVAGDAFNAENMNDLETRIQNGFNAVEQAQAELNENSNWKQLLLAENIPATFTQYDVQWNECKELIFVLGFYGNVLETIVEPVSLFATHNGEGNRIIFGASDEVEIYASLPTSNDSMFIKNGGRSTNVLRIYGR